MNRREMLGLSAAGLATLAMTAQSQAQALDTEMNAAGAYPSDSTEILPLWPDTPPGGENVHLKTRVRERSEDPAKIHDRISDHVMAPTLTVFRPAHPNGAAVIIAPGGGYLYICEDKEGYDMVPFLHKAGITVFLLRYRLPGEGWANRENVPLQDGQRAMRVVRSHAGKYGLDPHKIGVMGFSAGGHLAATLVTRFAETVYAPVDKADKLDPRPDFGCLMYPVVTTGPGTHQGSRDNLLGTGQDSAKLVPATSCENQVSENTPPTFLAMAADDGAVPPLQNGLALFMAMQKWQIPSALHVFEHGGHGFAIRQTTDQPCAIWPKLFVDWAAPQGFALKTA